MRVRRGFRPRLPHSLPVPSRRLPTRFLPEDVSRDDSVTSSASANAELPTVKLPVPEETITFASRLLDQQLWCWGQDIVRPSRNALIDYGFARYESPPEKKQISHYILSAVNGPAIKPHPGRKVSLWGSGIFHGHPAHGAIYLRRYTFAPVFMDFQCPIETIGGPDEFPEPPCGAAKEGLPVVLQLLGDLCQWIVHYESWAQAHLGRQHREHCLRDWKKTVASVTEIVPGWERLANLFHHTVVNGK